MEKLVLDLSLFSDLGTEPPVPVQTKAGMVVRLIRNGDELELFFSNDGRIIERGREREDRHFNFRALLASKNFGNLGRWADNQITILKSRAEKEGITLHGSFGASDDVEAVPAVDKATQIEKSRSDSVHVLLVNGPAGIGKTAIIRALAYGRARDYRVAQQPLVLHVESRGRMLQNVMDLMAFSLQTLRVDVTYDQVPVFVRHGLVTLAVDGFDELGDPSGYDLAWAQINELVSAIRGQGTLVLAGRETFIGSERLLSALTSFNPNVDRLQTLTLKATTPKVARDWLLQRDWSEELLSQENVQPLFEAGSYALRPFFLEELAKKGVAEQISDGTVQDLTSFLVKAMIEREARKFGADVESVAALSTLQTFVSDFLEEVARDLADNQTEAISQETIAWIAELAATDKLPQSVIGIVKNRAQVVAFLSEDERRGYRRFSHGQLLNFFLAKVTIKSVLANDVPKYIRRNILGSDFLYVFDEVLRSFSFDAIDEFVVRCLKLILDVPDHDRTRRNLASIVMTSLGVCDGSDQLQLSDVSIDETVVLGTAGKIALENVTIAQLDIRGADIQAIDFRSGCHIVSLIADEATIVPDSLPRPDFVETPERSFRHLEIDAWLRRREHTGNSAPRVIPDRLRGHPLLALLARMARHRGFWIRSLEDKSALRILSDPHWETLKDILEKHELLTSRRDVPASGAPSYFFHLRRREDILHERMDDPDIRTFFQDVVAVANDDSM